MGLDLSLSGFVGAGGGVAYLLVALLVAASKGPRTIRLLFATTVGAQGVVLAWVRGTHCASDVRWRPKRGMPSRAQPVRRYADVDPAAIADMCLRPPMIRLAEGSGVPPGRAGEIDDDVKRCGGAAP